MSRIHLHHLVDRLFRYRISSPCCSRATDSHGALLSFLWRLIASFGAIIHALIVKDILYSAIVNKLKDYHSDEMPLLIYPKTYAEESEIASEKIYRLWVLNTQFLDQYFRIINEFKKDTIRN